MIQIIVIFNFYLSFKTFADQKLYTISSPLMPSKKDYSYLPNGCSNIFVTGMDIGFLTSGG